MADEPTTPAPTDNTPAPAEPAERTVPYDRFKAVNDKAKTLESQVNELNTWKEEQEAKSLSDLEKERKAREKAEKDALDARSEAASVRRETWLHRAASAENFQDPSDAVAHLGKQDFESEADARKAVKDLAKEKKHLLKSEGDTPPPEIGKVLQNGQPVDKPDPQQVRASEVDQEAQAVLAAVNAARGQRQAA